MKGLLEQPTEVLCRVVHYLSPWDIEAFTSTHSFLRCVGSQALAVHCEKKQRFSHLELGCNETIHALDLISALLEHEENFEYVQSLSVGYDDAITSIDSKTSPDKIVHLLSKYPNLKDKAEQVIKASAWGDEEVTFPSNEDWNDFPHIFPTSESGYAEDTMYFLMSLSPNLKLLRLAALDDELDFEPLRYVINATSSGQSHDAMPSCHLRELRLHSAQMARWWEIISGNISLEVLKGRNVFDNMTGYQLSPSRQHPSLHTIVLQKSAVSAASFRQILHEVKALRSLTYCYDDSGLGPQWEPHRTLAILKDTASDHLVHLDMTHPRKEMSSRYTFDGLQLNLDVLRDFKVLRTLRLESILLFQAKVKDGSSLAKTSLSTQKAFPSLKFNFEMGRLEVQQLRYFLPASIAKVSLVGNLHKEDTVATTRKLAKVKARAPAFSELVLEGVHSRGTEEMRQAIQAECDNAKVSLRIFPTRLDAPPEIWWKAQS